MTGATGFIGSHAVASLLRAGHTVRVFVRDPGKLGRVLAPLGLGEQDVEIAIGEVSRNHTATAKRGRDPEFRLMRNAKESTVQEWATEILEKVLAIAEIIDGHENDRSYSDAVRSLRPFVDHPEATISARIVNELEATGSSFFEFALGM